MPEIPLRLLAMLLILAPAAVMAGALPTEPMLRVESGGHTALIRSVATDRAQRYFVTASDDKTARVWEIPPPSSLLGRENGVQLLRVLRPPVGPGHEGKLYAAALSPDGSTVACGGWTGWDHDGKGSLYLFDRESGELTKRVNGFPEVIKGIAFSPDGRLVAVTLGGNGGLYVLRSADWKIALADRDYGGAAHGIAFSGDGRLVTTSWDGSVRLYDAALRLVARRQGGSGRPFGVAFSRDGSLLAVGSASSSRVELLSGRDLAFRHAATATGAAEGAFSSVAWGENNELVAAGSVRSARGYLLRRWGDAGKGEGVDFAVAAGDVMALAPLSGGRLIFAGAAPEAGIVGREGERLFHRGSEGAEFRESQPDFRLSEDGRTVQFGFAAAGSARARFSVPQRTLENVSRPPSTALALPALAAEGIAVNQWQNGTSPTLNGLPLALEPFETARSLAVAREGSLFLLGTDWRLRCFDRFGKERWKLAAPGIVWGVNLSADGRLAVAALGDGTIRWYRLSDGRELLALFAHGDRRRWVAWTPSGYYDASTGAEELAGWQLNNGPDGAGDFFPVSRFRSAYCRPDIITRILDTADEEEARKLADAAAGSSGERKKVTELLPPVVVLRSPADATVVEGEQAVVAFSVRSPSGEPATGIRVLVDGRPAVFSDLNAGVKDGVRRVAVRVPAGRSEISLIAENRYAASEPASVRVVRSPSPSEEISILPKLYILAIGVSAYPSEELTLAYAAKDATDFVSLMAAQKGELYGEVSVQLITDAAATRDGILQGLEWLKRQSTSRDVALLFLSGHGVTDGTGRYYFLPADGDPLRPATSAVVFSSIRDPLMTLAAKAVLFVDTCHSGRILGGRGDGASLSSVINDLSSSENGVVVFTSSTGEQYSLEDPRWGNGAFTKALIEGISGKADFTGKGRITVTALDLWVSERVQELTGGKQTPTTAKPRTIPDFALALKR